MNPADVVMATKPVAAALELLQIPYYISGSVASSAYGMARATMDVDIVADIKAQHASALADLLREAYYIDEGMILEAVRRQGSFNLIHLETILKVDIFVLKSGAYHQVSLQRRRKDTLGGAEDSTEFYFGSVEDVILSKLDWYRLGGETSERQWRDILGILKVQKQGLDKAYLGEWATKLQVVDLLQRAYIESYRV